jgi:Na+/melibiose symporter-like transporter
MDFFLIWLAFAVLTAMAASGKGRNTFGWFILGCVFGIFALIAVLVMSSLKLKAETPSSTTHVTCPDCAELVRKEAKVCKHCGCKLIPQLD